MSRTTIRRIKEMTDRETDIITDLLVRAFADNAAAVAMTGGNDELRDLLFRSMVRAGGLAGHLYVLENDLQEIVTTALWFAPGTDIFSSEEQRELGYNKLMSKLDEETHTWWKNEYGLMTSKFFKEALSKSTTECWWLSVLGTDPRHQKRGYATILLHDGLKKMRSPNLAALGSITEENAAFYTKAGFPVRGKMEMPSRFGSFPVYAHSCEV